jgi:hypothetical protein
VFDTQTHVPSQPYEALSYTWGAPGFSNDIVLHSSRFKVGRNCFEAIQRLRWKTQSRRIFIDAVCINQNDVAERNTQVGLMRHVYSQADRVIAWIGEPKENEDNAIAHCFREMRVLYAVRGLLGNIVDGVVATRVRRILRSPPWPISSTDYHAHVASSRTISRYANNT